MKKHNKHLLSLLVAGAACISVQAQLGINTDAPKASLHIESSDPEMPSPNEGLLVPRVTSLNMTDPKEKGLLVFLDFENEATPEIEKGFYWWNGTSWIPFFSMNKVLKNFTVTYAGFESTFREGTPITESTSTNTRWMKLDSSTLVANDEGNFEINSNGELLVKKPGTYHILAIISLKSVSTDAGRDAYEAKVFVNGSEPSPNLRTAYGFPSGGTTYNSNSTISGYVKLNANDRVAIQINRYYRDTGTTVTITPNGDMSSLTLTYMGNF